MIIIAIQVVIFAYPLNLALLLLHSWRHFYNITGVFNPYLMKKLLSVSCLYLYGHSFSQVEISSTKASGEKVLMRAIAIIVNPESNKKAPQKPAYLSSKERP